MKTSLGFVAILLIAFASGYLIGVNVAKIGLDTPYVKDLVANNLHNLIELVQAILWPLAVVLAIWMFQDDVRRVVDAFTKNATRIEGFGMAIALRGGQPPIASLTPKQDAVANIYWLGADVMFTVGCLQEGLDKRFVLHGIQQARFHAEAAVSYTHLTLPTKA